MLLRPETYENPGPYSTGCVGVFRPELTRRSRQEVAALAIDYESDGISLIARQGRSHYLCYQCAQFIPGRALEE